MKKQIKDLTKIEIGYDIENPNPNYINIYKEIYNAKKTLEQNALENFWETCPNPREQYNDYKILKELIDKKHLKNEKWVETLEDVIMDLQRLKILEHEELKYIKEINKEIEIVEEIINYIKIGESE